jgi:hypothetical protein
MAAGSGRETIMYPNPALSAGQLAIIAAVALLTLAIWIGSVFAAARAPRYRENSAGTSALPQHPGDTEEPARKAA